MKQKWEYLVIDLTGMESRNAKEVQDVLNKAGADGWELAWATGESWGMGFHFYFKRPVADGTPPLLPKT